jgi:hypothetical protein
MLKKFVNIDNLNTYKKYLPSTKISIYLATIFSILFVFMSISFSEKSGPLAASLILPKTLAETAAVDSDEDGVSDWEERLWGTDPFVKVSNQDGLSDREYINKRKQIAEDAEVGTKIPLNSTGKLTYELLETGLALTSSGSDVDNQKLALELSSAAIKKIQQDTSPALYKKEDLKIVSASKENSDKYINEINSAIKKAQSSGLGKEFPLIHDGVFNQKESSLIKAASYAIVYGNLTKTMLKMSVPETVVSQHLFMINIFSNLENSVSNSIYLNGDPAKGIAFYSRYIKTLSDIQKILLAQKQK